MRPNAGPQRHTIVVWLLAGSFALTGCTSPAGTDTARPTAPPPVAIAEAAGATSDDDLGQVQTNSAMPATPTARQSTPTAVANTATSAPPTATTAPPTPTGPTVIPTPSPRPASTAPRVGMQVGHLNAAELPEELARFRSSTGARYGDVGEAELNYDIAIRVQSLLEAQGVIVDLLPATVPPGYDADAFLALHADGSTGTAARGWKLATPWRASRAAQQLLAAVSAAYGPATGMPEDVGGITVNMRGYYAFNYRRHQHAVARTTPAIIVEMGFMTSAADRAVLFGQPDRVANGIANGVLAYLGQRDPNDGAALLPPDLPTLRTAAGGATMRASPDDAARVVARIDGGERIFAIERRAGWYQVFARNIPNSSGWVRADELVETNEPPVFPTTTNP